MITAYAQSHLQVDLGMRPHSIMHYLYSSRYCTHIVSEEMDSCVETLLSELVRFQDRQFLRDPTKAKAKRRYVCGLREVMKHLSLRRLKCVILPPNLDRIQSTGTKRGREGEREGGERKGKKRRRGRGRKEEGRKGREVGGKEEGRREGWKTWSELCLHSNWFKLTLFR